ncbi:MAG: sialidase family protein [Vicinamibacteria bacterium]
MKLTTLALFLSASVPFASAHDHAAPAAAARPSRAAAAVRGPDPAYSAYPTPAFDGKGHLFVAFVEGDAVFAATSADLGRTFGPAVRVTPRPERIDANGEARPKIAADGQGGVFVSWTRKGAKPYTGDVRFARSTDGGRTFAPPVTVNDDGLPTGHRFDALSVGRSGEVLLAWVDKRDLEQAKTAGKAYDGAAIYSAVSRDGGRTFGKNAKVKDNACECCRLAVARDGAGRPVVLWRDILPGGIRDHSLAVLGAAPRPTRATFDGWKVNACPHHGPSLAIADGTYHLAWFTAEGRNGGGLFYARSSDGGATYGEPRRLAPASGAGHAYVLAAGGAVDVVWKESRGDGSVVRAARSQDGGATFAPARDAAATAGRADHPLLVSDGPRAYLSWFTDADGYRLVPLGD